MPAIQDGATKRALHGRILFRTAAILAAIISEATS
jgi:hypothetical protein